MHSNTMRKGSFTVKHKDPDLKTDHKKKVNINIKLPAVIHEKGRCITVTAGYGDNECVGIGSAGGVDSIHSTGSDVYDGVHSTGRGVHSAGSSVGDGGNSVMNRQDSLISTPGLVDKASPTSSRCLSGDVGMERCKQIPEIVASSKQQRSRCISPIMLKDAGIDENDVGTIRYNRVSEPILPLEDRERRKSPMMVKGGGVGGFSIGAARLLDSGENYEGSSFRPSLPRIAVSKGNFANFYCRFY